MVLIIKLLKLRYAPQPAEAGYHRKMRRRPASDRGKKYAPLPVEECTHR